MTKVAVSIPEDLFEQLERERLRSRRSRSALVSDALRCWLQSDERDPVEQRYVRGYLEVPEHGAEAAAVASAVAESWEPWE